MAKSALHITYKDLIDHQERNVRWMEQNLLSLKLSGRMNPNAADKRLECARKILSLLKKHQKDPQLNLNDLFNKY